MITEIHVRPDEVEQGSRETLVWRFDTAARLATGETPANPTATLTNLRTGAAYPEGLDGVPLVDDVIYITQAVTDLEANATYRLSVGFDAGPNTWEMFLTIHCPA